MVSIFTLSACDEVPKPADNTPDTITEPAFEIRRPSEEQDEYGFYFTYIHCRVEEIYSVPDNVNLAVGGTNVTLVDSRGIQDGKMWYYQGCLPTLDCYEYYVLRNLLLQFAKTYY